jgi:flagellar protein FlbD
MYQDVTEMIAVSRLNDEQILVNPHLIETIEETPDTVITLTNGKKFIVKEPAAEVVKRIVHYRQTINDKNFSDINDFS